ncbi:transketolase family protein [Testudinibacter sp. P27/CKL/0425]
MVARANEQVKVDICYNNTNVKLFGLNSGASYGPLASTHHCLDDISIMRGFGNIQIYAPSSPNECRQIIDYAIKTVGPIYIRLDGKELPELHDENYQFIPGNIDVLQSGKEVALIAVGSTVHEVVSAAEILKTKGIIPVVINVPSIRPCDTDSLFNTIKDMKQIVTVEEHNINGGLGSLVAEVLAENGVAIKLKRLGISDGDYALAADRKSMRAHHGIDADSIVKLVLELL